jgi:hypothetical protein
LPEAVPLGSSWAMTWPTVTVSSGWASSLVIVPLAGARGNLGVDLIGRHLDDGLAFLDELAFALVPLEDHALGDRFPHLGHLDLDDPAVCHS